ncbi:MAG TPA: TldD/PmbA family protein [Bryobacteraceae bacterium]|jgi:PmbA protein|nr:TldD/PmbA family protein [Bryobacteraceae bacterium]
MIHPELATQTIRLALDRGATDAECTLAEGEEFSALVRMRSLEKLKDAGSRAAGLRVLVGQRVGSSYTSDLSSEGIRMMVDSAIQLAAISTEDPHAGLPDPSELGALPGDLRLHSDDISAIDTDYRVELAKLTEEAAFAADPRITNSEGASFDAYSGERLFANSRGFLGSYRTSSCSLSTTPVARQGESMERDYWYSSARSHSRIESPSAIGRRAAERTVRRLGARKVPTQKVRIIFDQQTSRTLLSNIFDAVEGDAIYRQASFLAGKLGERVASENVTIIDDGTLPGLFGTSPFDDEGVPSRRTVVIDRGVLKSYLLNTYTARKLGMKTTGNAARGITGNTGVGHGNLFLEKGERSPDELIRGIRKGLYVTELIGSGINIVTGDYSRGAAGQWIENGEFAYPVSEITIASTLQRMLMDLESVGSDLEFRGSVASPTLVIQEMTVSGQ